MWRSNLPKEDCYGCYSRRCFLAARARKSPAGRSIGLHHPSDSGSYDGTSCDRTCRVEMGHHHFRHRSVRGQRRIYYCGRTNKRSGERNCSGSQLFVPRHTRHTWRKSFDRISVGRAGFSRVLPIKRHARQAHHCKAVDWVNSDSRNLLFGRRTG